jgi:transposase
MPELSRPTQAELDRMSHAEKDALIAALFDLVGQHERRLRELESQVKKTSRNSSQPPSTDGLPKGPAMPRRPGEKPLGGQPGHQGATRTLVDTPDAVRELRPVGACGCGTGLAGLPASPGERRQQIEIPEPKPVITEFRQLVVTCPGCGQIHRGAFPAGVTPNVSFGPRLKAYAVGLVNGHFVALDRACDLIADQYGVRPSDGAVQNWILDAGQRLADDHAAGREAIRAAAVANFDESGMRVGGRLHGLHVAATATVVHYTVHPQRGAEAMDAAGILPHFTGTAVHDHWRPYGAYTDCSHAFCNAHHLRELRYCEELTGHFWPYALRHLLVEGHQAIIAARAAGLTALAPEYVAELLARYDRQVSNGLQACPVRPPEPGQKGRVKQHPATNLLLRLRDYKTEVWRFLTDWRVPFDNNRAERLVRPVKVKLKVIGGFRALGGSTAFCILRSVWETNKLNGINPFDTLRLAFEGR